MPPETRARCRESEPSELLSYFCSLLAHSFCSASTTTTLGRITPTLALRPISSLAELPQLEPFGRALSFSTPPPPPAPGTRLPEGAARIGPGNGGSGESSSKQSGQVGKQLGQAVGITGLGLYRRASSAAAAALAFAATTAASHRCHSQREQMLLLPPPLELEAVLPMLLC